MLRELSRRSQHLFDQRTNILVDRLRRGVWQYTRPAVPIGLSILTTGGADENEEGN